MSKTVALRIDLPYDDVQLLARYLQRSDSATVAALGRQLDGQLREVLRYRADVYDPAYAAMRKAAKK